MKKFAYNLATVIAGSILFLAALIVSATSTGIWKILAIALMVYIPFSGLIARGARVRLVELAEREAALPAPAPKPMKAPKGKAGKSAMPKLKMPPKPQMKGMSVTGVDPDTVPDRMSAADFRKMMGMD